jgi:SAM-dependent MidA family methyltransferase
MLLTGLIRETIRTSGPQPFAWFMQQALYNPEHGYYSSGRCEIGRRGDYFTNVSVGPFFGKLLAAQFMEMWERLGKIDKFVIVEQGAHHGEFARDVLKSARDRHPDFFAALRYRIVESFPVLQDRQLETLAGFEGKIGWRASIDALEPFTGVHFSNELLDAMPVHLICSDGSVAGETAGVSQPRWREKFVTLNGDEFAFVAQPIGNRELQDQLQKLPLQHAHYETEVSLAALDWIGNLSRKLKRGYVLVVDYGHPRDEFYAAHRSAGTLQVHAQHRLLSSPFDAIGRADISTHVEWTSVAERAEARGLQVTGFTDQHHFITGILSELLRQELSQDVDPKTKRALQTLLHPEMLGRSFQVLALEKDASATDTPATTEDVDLDAPLAGFKFAREPRSALSLDCPNPRVRVRVGTAPRRA